MNSAAGGATALSRAVFRALACCLLAALVTATGCRQSPPNTPVPLRAILYTEAPEGVAPNIPGYEEWLDPAIDPIEWPSEFRTTALPSSSDAARLYEPDTAEAAVVGVFAAMLSSDPSALEPYLFSPGELARAARMGIEAAGARCTEIREGLQVLTQSFGSQAPSIAREGGLSDLLQPMQVTLGAPQLATGGRADRRDAEMHSNNTLAVHVIGSNVNFTIYFPRLLLDSQGQWRLASVPTMDRRYASFHRLGLDLKPDLMDPDHAAIPISAGNYWHYSTRSEAPNTGPVPGDPTGPDAPPTGDTSVAHGGYRDTVVSVDDYQLYRVARFRRSFDDEAEADTGYTWLITPNQILSCNAACRARADNLEWILDWARTRVPLLVRDLVPGESWRTGGRRSGDAIYRVAGERSNVQAPAGIFPGVLAITRSHNRGIETRYLATGIGVVARTNRRGGTIEHAELRSYRIFR